MSIELQTAREMLTTWIEAEKAVSTGQRYRIGTRELERADLRDIASRISYWRAQVQQLDAAAKGRGGMRVQRIIPRD